MDLQMGNLRENRSSIAKALVNDAKTFRWQIGGDDWTRSSLNLLEIDCSYCIAKNRHYVFFPCPVVSYLQGLRPSIVGKMRNHYEKMLGNTKRIELWLILK